jgi:hypothetical protein
MKPCMALIVRTSQDLNPLEAVSLVSLNTCYSGWKKFLVYPYSKPPIYTFPDWERIAFPDEFFGSPQRYSRLMLSRRFYDQFQGFSHVHITHLDVLALERPDGYKIGDHDYVGAPWFAREDGTLVFKGAGNGGFSIRRVDAIKDLLSSIQHVCSSDASSSTRRHSIMTYSRICRCLKVPVGVWASALPAVGLHEDVFFSRIASRMQLPLRVAAPVDAMRFSWETEPRWCYKLSNGKLPIGIHGWWKYDREFVEKIAQSKLKDYWALVPRL